MDGEAVSLEQRVRAMRRKARRHFYNDDYPNPPGVTNWRMFIARQFKIPVAEVRRLLGEGKK